MRTCFAVQACALGILAVGCSETHAVGARVSNPTRSSDASLACGLGEPSDTLSGVDRCLLEAWKPCRIDRSGVDPWSIELGYDASGHLIVEKRTVAGRATRIYRYEAGHLSSVVQSGFEPFEETYGYAEGRLSMSDRTIFRPSQVDFSYDAAGRLVEWERRLFQPTVERYEWSGERLVRIDRSVSVPSEVSLPSEIVLSYTPDGLLEREENVGSKPHLRTFTYDDRGRLDVETREGHAAHVTYYAWDTADRLTQVERTASGLHTLELSYTCE